MNEPNQGIATLEQNIVLLLNKLKDNHYALETLREQLDENKRHLELLENGPKQLSQAWLLGALYNEWKKIKGYDKFDPKENEGQCQSSLQEFFQSQKDQGI